MPIRSSIIADRNGRPAPAPIGTGLTSVSATAPLVLTLTGSVLTGSIDTTGTLYIDKVTTGGGEFATEGALDPSVRPVKGVEVVLGSQADPNLTGASALLVEKYLGADITVNAGHAVTLISKKVGGLGAAGARSGGLNIEAIDTVGWGGVGAQAFCEGVHSKVIGAWPAGVKGSIQPGVFHAYLEPGGGADDFGFVNCLEVTVTNRVKDAGARSWAVLNGATPSWPHDFSCVEHIFNYPDSTHPVDVLLCLGNGYGEEKAYNGLVIRSGAIQSGGYLIRTPYLTVADTGHVTVGPSAGGGDAGYAFGVVEETAQTNDVVVMENLARRTTGTAEAGLGLGTRVSLEDAAGNEVGVFQHNYEWINPAAGTRSGKWSAFAIDAGGARTIWVAGSDGSQSVLGFHGAGGVPQQSIGGVPAVATAGAAYGAPEQAMLQAAYDGIRYVKAALNLCGLTKV